MHNVKYSNPIYQGVFISYNNNISILNICKAFQQSKNAHYCCYWYSTSHLILVHLLLTNLPPSQTEVQSPKFTGFKRSTSQAPRERKEKKKNMYLSILLSATQKLHQVQKSIV